MGGVARADLGDPPTGSRAARGCISLEAVLPRRNMAKDLLELSPTSAGARQVVSEFEIRAAPPAR